MRAMVYLGPYKIRVEEKPMPVLEHPYDAIVRVTLVAICGSDLHLYHGMLNGTITRSTTCRFCTEEPTCSTTPMNS